MRVLTTTPPYTRMYVHVSVRIGAGLRRIHIHCRPVRFSRTEWLTLTDATACAALFGCMHSCLHPPAPCGTQHKNNHMDTFASQYKQTQRQVHVHLRMNYVYLQQQSLKAPQPALVFQTVFQALHASRPCKPRRFNISSPRTVQYPLALPSWKGAVQCREN